MAKRKTNKTRMATGASASTDTAKTEGDVIDKEIAALESELGDDEILADDTGEGVSDDELEAAVSEVEMDEARGEAYEAQPASETDMSTEPVEKKAAKAPSKPKKKMTFSKKSEVARDKLGENANGFILEDSDAELSEKKRTAKRDAVIDGIDNLAKKVGEKAVNLVAYLSGDVKLSAYTKIAISFLITNGEMTTKDLIEHYQDSKANGVKGYSVGTARSQAHQMFQLLPEFKVCVMDGKTMKVNNTSMVIHKFTA